MFALGDMREIALSFCALLVVSGLIFMVFYIGFLVVRGAMKSPGQLPPAPSGTDADSVGD